MKQYGDVLAFYSYLDIYSNHHRVYFTYRGILFNCVEQFLMYHKARLFDDQDMMQQILMQSSPVKQKALGRLIRNYDDAKWAAVRGKVLFVGVLEKFRQNPTLLRKLLRTEDLILVEASPHDRLYGVGLGENDPRIADQSKWRGENLLGRVTMAVRDYLRARQAIAS